MLAKEQKVVEGVSADGAFERRARLAAVWHDLVTPVRAISGYQEIIVDQGKRLRLDQVAPYFEKVMISAGLLSEMVNELLDPSADVSEENAEALAGVQATLRHDLRTPLNAIIGYSEMALEDLEDHEALATIGPDVERLLTEARSLLDRIDAIVDFSRTQGGEAGEDRRTDAAVAGLLRTLRDDTDVARTTEVGRILVVDDNESNRDLLGRRLAHEGHEVVLAESGKRALEVLAEEAFDLILLDLLMPDMNGIEVLERLKSDEKLHGVPVVMISGLSETEAVIRCIEAGAEDYLPKPFNIVVLRARINACLERKRWRAREQEYLARLRAEKDRSEALLRNILPEPIVHRLNAGEMTIADSFPEVSILFADLVNFTATAARMTPERLVGKLNRIFSSFDSLAMQYGVEKIKTIGDAYMAVAGLPAPQPDHAEAIAHFAIGMLEVIAEENVFDAATPFQIRIGIHTGPVVAGVIGRHKFIYDVWGDTVNIASRLESTGSPGRIHISETTQRSLAGRFEIEARGLVELEGRGEANAFFLIGPVSRGKGRRSAARPVGPGRKRARG